MKRKERLVLRDFNRTCGHIEVEAPGRGRRPGGLPGFWLSQQEDDGYRKREGQGATLWSQAERQEPGKMKKELVWPGKQDLSWIHFKKRNQHLLPIVYFSPGPVSFGTSWKTKEEIWDELIHQSIFYPIPFPYYQVPNFVHHFQIIVWSQRREPIIFLLFSCVVPSGSQGDSARCPGFP